MDDPEKIKKEFMKLQTREDVAEILGIEDGSLRYFLYAKRPDNMYVECSIRKKDGGTREICVPQDKLKSIQRKLLRILETVYNKKPAAHGFVVDRNSYTNAKNHCKRTLVFNIDLKDFFSQIHFGRVMGMLKCKPYCLGEEAALVIAQLVCYKGKLPQGAPTSPIISNMICAPLDTQLTKLAKKYKLVYSRYADDITFSTYKPKFPREVVDVVADNVIIGIELEEILNKNSFEVNPKKINLRTRNERQEVTGLVVNKFVNLKREYLRQIRAILHKCRKNGVYEAAKEYVERGYCKNSTIIGIFSQDERTEKGDEIVLAWFEKVIKGKVEYIRCIRGKENTYFLKYAIEVNKIFGKEVFVLTKQIQFYENCDRWCYIFESKSVSHPNQGSGFLLRDFGIITNSHVTNDGEFYNITTHKGEQISVVSSDLFLVSEDKDIDYALYSSPKSKNEGWELGDSNELKAGVKIKIVGFPNYSKGDTPYIQSCEITSKTKSYMGKEIFTVSGRIVHGASGGAVLDENYKVVGIIQCGANSFDEEEEHILPGVIPINDVIKHINSSSRQKMPE